MLISRVWFQPVGRAQDFRLGVWGSGFSVQGLGTGFGVQGLGIQSLRRV